jgi:hypothetical protein
MGTLAHFANYNIVIPSQEWGSVANLARQMAPETRRFAALARDPPEQWMGKDCVLLLGDVSARTGVSC